MNLYLIYQDENRGYDTYDSVVVAAESKDIARNIFPSDYADWESYTWANKSSQVRVSLLGIAKEGTKRGVILASFNDG